MAEPTISDLRKQQEEVFLLELGNAASGVGRGETPESIQAKMQVLLAQNSAFTDILGQINDREVFPGTTTSEASNAMRSAAFSHAKEKFGIMFGKGSSSGVDTDMLKVLLSSISTFSDIDATEQRLQQGERQLELAGLTHSQNQEKLELEKAMSKLQGRQQGAPVGQPRLEGIPGVVDFGDPLQSTMDSLRSLSVSLQNLEAGKEIDAIGQQKAEEADQFERDRVASLTLHQDEIQDQKQRALDNRDDLRAASEAAGIEEVRIGEEIGRASDLADVEAAPEPPELKKLGEVIDVPAIEKREQTFQEMINPLNIKNLKSTTLPTDYLSQLKVDLSDEPQFLTSLTRVIENGPEGKRLDDLWFRKTFTKGQNAKPDLEFSIGESIDGMPEDEIKRRLFADLDSEAGFYRHPETNDKMNWRPSKQIAQDIFDEVKTSRTGPTFDAIGLLEGEEGEGVLSPNRDIVLAQPIRSGDFNKVSQGNLQAFNGGILSTVGEGFLRKHFKIPDVDTTIKNEAKRLGIANGREDVNASLTREDFAQKKVERERKLDSLLGTDINDKLLSGEIRVQGFQR